MACRVHPLEDGTYALRGQAPSSDACGLLTGSSALGSGELSSQGDVVQMGYSQVAQMIMTGQYREGLEQFYLDGTANNVIAVVRGVSCQLDLVEVHLDGTADGAAAFHGQIRFDYQALNSDSCACQATGAFSAVRQ
jgi:hypothetical protein